MGLFCWKRCQKRRTERKRIRQENRTARVQARNAAKSEAYKAGIDVSGAGVVKSGLSGLTQAIGLTSFGSLLGGGIGSGNVSGGVNFGKDQNKALIPIIIAVGAVVFLVFSFGGLFRKGRRR